MAFTRVAKLCICEVPLYMLFPNCNRTPANSIVTICFSEVFVVVSLTMFLPICLEQFARDNGMLLPDKTDPCLEIKEPVEGSLVEDARCVVKIGRTWIDTASFRCVGRALLHSGK